MAKRNTDSSRSSGGKCREIRTTSVSGDILGVLSLLGMIAAGRSYRGRLAPQNERLPVSVIGVVASGRMNFLLASGWTTLHRGQAFLVPIGCTTTLRPCGAGCSTAWVVYGPGPSDPLAGAGEPACHGGGLALAPAVGELCREFYGRRRPTLLAHWAGVVDAVARGLVEPPATQPELEELWHEVAHSPGRRWHVDDLAGRMGITRQHFCRLCKAQLGRTPRRQLLRLRMEQAAALLTATGASIAEVAQQVSYDDPFIFSRAFKNYFGLAPRHYRQRRR